MVFMFLFCNNTGSLTADDTGLELTNEASYV